MLDMTGRTGCRTMEMNGGSSASYLASLALLSVRALDSGQTDRVALITFPTPFLSKSLQAANNVLFSSRACQQVLGRLELHYSRGFLV